MNESLLPANLLVDRADSGCLLRNLTAFAGVLRKIGFAAGLDKENAAATALAQMGVHERADVFWALATVFVEKREQLELFRQAFHLFWRGLRGTTDEKTLAPTEGAPLSAAFEGAVTPLNQSTPQPEVTHSASLTENLADKDFEKMNKIEWHTALRLNRNMRTILPPIPTRRRRAATYGKPDMRRTIHRAIRRGGEDERLLFSRRRHKPSQLVVLADISGSMSAYARAFLHFIAGLAVGDEYRLHAFLLGTQLTAVGRRRGGDVEAEAARIAASAQDWDGGTRLTPSLRQFNRLWLRRVGCGEATVLFATDGLERNCDKTTLNAEVARLRKSCRRLLWLNPLLRYDGYAPLAQGAKILSHHADAVCSIHNVRSLQELTAALGAHHNRFSP